MLNFHLTVVQQIAILALQLGVIVFVAKFCGDLAKKCKLPSVLGELAAGILIGPYLLGGIGIPLHGLENGLFAISNTVVVEGEMITGKAVIENVTFQLYHSSLYALATLGSILLLFMSGLETNLRMFFRYSLIGTIVGLGGVIFSFAFGDLLGMYMLHTAFMDPRCLFLGILCTATSVGITARILSERKKIDTPEGVTILAAAVIDDVLGIICLAIVMGIVSAPAGGKEDWGRIALISLKCVTFWLVATGIGMALARYIAKFLKIFKSPTIFASLAFGLALLLSGIFEQQGLAMIIGAYVMGLSLSKTDVSFALQRSLQPLYNLLVPVFFVVMGMLLDVRVFANWNVLKIGLIYSILAVLAKIIGCALPAFFMNFNWIGSLRIGTGMVPRGEVALIIAGIGMTVTHNGSPILNASLFGVAIIMTLATTVLAPPLLSIALNIPGKGVRRVKEDLTVIHTAFDFPSVMITDFVLRHLVETLEREDYMLSSLDKESGIMQIRKDNLAFAMNVHDSGFVFESNPHEVPFIRALIYETIVDLYQDLKSLKDLTAPDELQKKFFTADSTETRKLEAQAIPKNHSLSGKIDTGSIILDLHSDSKEGVIRELIDALDTRGLLLNRDLCVQDVLQRENIISTCMQNGLGLPHARTDGVKSLVAAVGIRKDGYKFDSIDGKPTRIFVLCLSPKSANQPHIEFIAFIATLLKTQENIDRILSASSRQEVFDVFNAKPKK